MNWFKKYCSHNLRLPGNINYQIDNIINKIVDFYKNFNGLPIHPIFVGKINLFDRYSNKNLYISVFINNDFVEGGDTAAKIDRKNNNVYFNIFKHVFFDPKSIDYVYLKNILINQLYHELTHSIDPKITKLDKKYEDIDEFLKPTEFDAYSQEITKYIENAYKNKKNRDIILKWLSSSNFGTYDEGIITLLSIPYNLINIMFKWRLSNNINLLKKLRQRIYNSIMEK